MAALTLLRPAHNPPPFPFFLHLPQVSTKSGVLSIVLDRDVSQSASAWQQLVITAMGKEEVGKARMLLEIHLKNQEALARAERRVLQVCC